MQTKEYRTRDKSGWGEGAWQDEPDKIQFEDPDTGLPCLIVRNQMGALCGYVGVPEGHPWYRKGFYDLDEISVHGGPTFTGHCTEGGEEDHSICHVPDPGEPDNVWWVGFDCHHAYDVGPAYEARMREQSFRFNDLMVTMASLTERAGREAPQYRDVAYVRREIASLARQAVEAA